MRRDRALSLVLGALVAAGCATATTQVRRMDQEEVKDLSGRWNDTDSRLVAEEMIADSLSRPWLANATAAEGRPPSVIVLSVRNLSLEHISTETFVEDLQRALINSGRVAFVASSEERVEVRVERRDQDLNAREETRKAHGHETGADFGLQGTISQIQDKEGGEAVVMYQVNLKLTNLETNQIVWNGQKRIRKNIKRAAATW